MEPLPSILDRLAAGKVRAAIGDIDRYRSLAAQLPPDAPDRQAIGVLEGWEMLTSSPPLAAAALEPLVVALDRDVSRRRHLLFALLGLGTARVLAANAIAGTPPLERALTLTKEDWPRAHALRFLAFALEIREHFEAASERYQAAAAAYRRLADVFGAANAEYGAGSALMRLGRNAEAEGFLRRATQLFRACSGKAGLGSALRALSTVVAPRDVVEAGLLMDEARRVTPPDARVAQLDIAVGDAWLALNLGNPALALAALEGRDLSGDARIARDGMLIRAQALLAIGDVAGARAALPPPDPAALGDLERAAIEVEIAAADVDLAGLDRTLSSVERGLSRVRRDQTAIGPLRRAAERLSAPPTRDPDNAALCLQMAIRAGHPADDARERLRALRDDGARVPLGPFSVGRLLGEGGMGQVWHATHRESGRGVAIKVLRLREGKPSRRLQALFEAEVRAVARLDHPNVVQTLAAMTLDAGAAAMLGQTEGSPCLVMELVDAGALGDGWGADWPAIRALVLALLDALGHAHARGVFHLDVKPENVLLATSGGTTSPRLTDFGLAGMLARGGGRAFGTPSYMAPEQARGAKDEIGPWTDLYALGGLVWCLCTGSPPFGQGEPTSLMAAQCSAPLPAFLPRIPVPDGLAGWLEILLAKAPGDRFEFAADAAAALARLGDARTGSMTLVPALSGNTWGDTTEIAPMVSAEAPPPRTGRPPAAPMPADWRSERRDLPPPFLFGLGEGLLASRVARTVGREAILDRLWGHLRTLRETGRGRLVVIRGATGLGRTHLISAFAERCETTGAARVMRPAELTNPPRTSRPIVLVLDDLNRTPVPGLSALAATKLVVATAERAPPDLDAEVLDLTPLSDLEIGQILDHLLPLGRRTRQRLSQRAAGNPSFALALLTELVRRQALVGGPEGFELRADADPSLPTDVLALWQTRIDALAPTGSPRRAAWELLAVLGTEVNLAEWREACALAGLAEPDEALRVLVAAGWVQVGTSPRFSSIALREALIAGSAQAATWHDVCARVLDDDVRVGRQGRHLVAAGRPADALTPLRKGAADAVNAARIEECRGLLELWHTAADAAGLPANDPARAGIVVVWAHLAHHTGEDPLPALWRALPLVEGQGTVEESRVLYTLGGALREARRYAESIATYERAIANERGSGSQMLALSWLGLAHARFESGEDGTDAARAAKALFETVTPALTSRCDAAIGSGLVRLGRYDDAVPHLEAALPAARANGWPALEADLQTALSIVWFVRGDLAAAVARERAGLAALRGTGSDREIRSELAVAALLLLAGERDEPARILAGFSRFSQRFSPQDRAVSDLLALALDRDVPNRRRRLEEAASRCGSDDVRMRGLVERLLA